MKKAVHFITLFVIFYTGASFANSGEAHHSDGLTDETLKTIIYQAINVSAIVIGLVYLLRASVKQFFVEKKAAYVAAAEKAKIVRKAAEDERMQIQVQLNKLISTADESIVRAKQDAAEIKAQLLAEAQATSRRIREEAESAVRLEVEKAKFRLREQLMGDAFVAAQQALNSKVTNDDHARLQGEFINNIGAVQR